MAVCYVERDMFDLAKRFLERQMRAIDALRQAVAAQDFESIKKTGHDLKGSGGAYGLDALSHLGTELETAAGARNGDWVELLVTRLQQRLSAIELRVSAGDQQELATEVGARNGSSEFEPPVMRE